MGARKAVGWLKGRLADATTRGLALDDPQTTILRRQVIESKPFLKRVYGEWYELLLGALPGGEGRVLELGSGGGFFKEVFPELLASEVVAFQGVDLVADGRRLPFRVAALRAIVMTDVFHHLPDARSFLREAGRCVRPAGVLAMVEPWVSGWSRIVYRHFHHEPFAPDATDWEFPSEGPLSGANNALPWIVFSRDRPRFEKEFPEWSIRRLEPFMPIRYLLSGGVSLRSLMPAFTFDFWRRAEGALGRALEDVAMFALIVLERRADSGGRT